MAMWELEEAPRAVRAAATTVWRRVEALTSVDMK